MSDSKSSELNDKFDEQMQDLGLKYKLKNRYFSYSISQAIDTLESYWADYYSEHDESW